MTELELEREVRRLLSKYRLYGYHVRDSRTASEPGWPDWVIVGAKILYRELKDGSGTLDADQRHVRNLLLQADADYGVWRPADLDSGRIDKELRAVTLVAPYCNECWSFNATCHVPGCRMGGDPQMHIHPSRAGEQL